MNKDNEPSWECILGLWFAAVISVLIGPFVGHLICRYWDWCYKILGVN